MSIETQPRTMTQVQNPQQNQQIMAPPMRYDLKKNNYEQICSYINQQIAWGAYPTLDATEKALDFLKRLKENYNEGSVWTFGYIPAPPHSEVTRRVIGVDGYFFKMTTTLSVIDFIWHDRITNMFLFWGPTNFRVVKAMNSIRWRIHKCYTTPPATPKRAPYQYESIEDISEGEEENDRDTDYDDVPDLISHKDLQISLGNVPDNEMHSV